MNEEQGAAVARWLGWSDWFDRGNLWRTGELFDGVPLVRPLSYLTTPDGMMLILKTLRERGWQPGVDWLNKGTHNGHSAGPCWDCIISSEEWEVFETADTLPEAVLAATYAAIMQEGENDG